MGKKKKKKKLSVNQIKKRIKEMSSAEYKARKLAYEMLKRRSHSVVDIKEKVKRKAKKHKKDYNFDRDSD